MAVTAPVTAANHSEPTTETAHSSFEVSELSVPNATVGTRFIVTANITNPNKDQQTQAVELRFEGELLDRETITLDALETETVIFQGRITPNIVNKTTLPEWRFVSVQTQQHGTIEWFYLNTTTKTDQSLSKETQQNEIATQISEIKLKQIFARHFSTPIENIAVHVHTSNETHQTRYHVHYKNRVLVIVQENQTISSAIPDFGEHHRLTGQASPRIPPITVS